MSDKVKVRLRALHFIDGKEHRPGAVVMVNEFSAKWLVDRRMAEVVASLRQKKIERQKDEQH